MTFKSSLPTLGLAGVVAMAAMAGPAVADDVNPVPTFIPVPTERRMCSRAGRSLHSTSASPTR